MFYSADRSNAQDENRLSRLPIFRHQLWQDREFLRYSSDLCTAVRSFSRPETVRLAEMADGMRSVLGAL